MAHYYSVIFLLPCKGVRESESEREETKENFAE
jgi:hypothetical protein